MLESPQVKAGIEAIKEVLRLALLVAVPELIEYLTGATFDPIQKIILIGFLRGIDKYLHRVGKETEDDVLIKGLVRF